MKVETYQLIVIGSILSAFLFGFHLPALHDMIEHGATPRTDVLVVTVLFAICTLVGMVTLLRGARRLKLT
jgi:hypothetical protein